MMLTSKPILLKRINQSDRTLIVGCLKTKTKTQTHCKQSETYSEKNERMFERVEKEKDDDT